MPGSLAWGRMLVLVLVQGWLALQVQGPGPAWGLWRAWGAPCPRAHTRTHAAACVAPAGAGPLPVLALLRGAALRQAANQQPHPLAG